MADATAAAAAEREREREREESELQNVTSLVSIEWEKLQQKKQQERGREGTVIEADRSLVRSWAMAQFIMSWMGRRIRSWFRFVHVSRVVPRYDFEVHF